MPPPLAIFVVAGQSNAAGWGKPLPLEQRPNPRVWDLTFGAKPAVQPLGDAPGVGFPIPAGVALAARGLRVGLVQCADGGLAIDRWQRGADYYMRCLERVRSALKYGTLAGVFFSQGETDSQSLAKARAWPTKFTRFVTAIRTDLHAPTLPVVYQLTRDFTECEDCGLPYGADLRNGQRAIRLPRSVIVNADDLSVDGGHAARDRRRSPGPGHFRLLTRTGRTVREAHLQCLDAGEPRVRLPRPGEPFSAPCRVIRP